jgi:hypothetical protein
MEVTTVAVVELWQKQWRTQAWHASRASCNRELELNNPGLIPTQSNALLRMLDASGSGMVALLAKWLLQIWRCCLFRTEGSAGSTVIALHLSLAQDVVCRLSIQLARFWAFAGRQTPQG